MAECSTLCGNGATISSSAMMYAMRKYQQGNTKLQDGIRIQGLFSFRICGYR